MNNTEFLEIRFPEDISYGSIGGPMFSTEVNTTKSGIEYRNINWPYARSKFNIVYGIKTQKNMGELLSFFRIIKGKAYGFRFKDWNDYRAQDTKLLKLNEEQNLFALQKEYKFGGHFVNRRIYKPVNGTVNIFTADSKEKVECEIDYTTGTVLILEEIDENNLLSSFEFDIPARFDNDELFSSVDGFNLNSCSINIIEIIDENNFLN